MILTRKEAIKLISFVQMIRLSSDEKERKTLDALSEANIESATEAKKNLYLRKYLEEEFKYVKKSFIENVLTETLNCKIDVEGKDAPLFSCQCCGYKTLIKQGEYFICRVCFWEDDGSSQEEKFSSANKMTLREGKNNFELFGVVKKDFSRFVDKDRMLKYEK